MKQTFSRRERQMLFLVADGYQNKDVAFSLGISPRTVEKLRMNMVKKIVHELGVKRVGISEVTHYAISRGYIQLKNTPVDFQRDIIGLQVTPQA